MNQYKYKAKDKTGGLIEGKVEAETPEIAAKLLRQKSLLVISLKPIRTNPFSTKRLTASLFPEPVSPTTAITMRFILLKFRCRRW